MAKTQKTTNTNDTSAGRPLPDRQAPESLPSEAAVLGSMIIDPACIGAVVEQLNQEAFYRIEHQLIFQALVSLYEKNPAGALDAVLLRDELDKKAQLQTVGGAEYLAKIMESVPSSANVEYYTKILQDKYLLRQLIVAAGGILEEAYSPGGETGVKLDRAEQKIFAIAEKKIKRSATPLSELLMPVYEHIEARDGQHVTGLPTGFFELDQITCGLQNGEMIIIAGRPSMGKTSFALNIAEHIAVKQNAPVAIFSLEMSNQLLAERLLCSSSAIPSQLVRKGMLEPEQFQQLAAACDELKNVPFYIDDSAALTPLELRAKARRLASRYDIKCIVVDYLQLMSLGTGRVESRQQEITTISRYLKGLARELNIPVIVLSQLNRAAETREHHRPRMSDLRESGSIEQDADVVMLLHREDYYKHDEQDYENTNTAEIIIAKQRNGPTGMIKLVFREEITRFENASYADEPI